MMNIGIVVPADGYLQALKDACERHGAVLIFDEVKCGGTIAYGGAAERFGVVPHLAAWAKAIGGGATTGAFGGDACDHGARHEGRGPAGHVQRQPAVVGGGPRGAHPGADARRVRPPRQARHDARRRVQPGDRRQRHPGAHGRPRREGLRLVPGRAAHELPGLPGDDPRDLLGLVPVDGQPGHLHDARRRGAVDDLGAAHRGRHPDLRRRVRRVLPGARAASARPAVHRRWARCTATPTRPRRSRARSSRTRATASRARSRSTARPRGEELTRGPARRSRPRASAARRRCGCGAEVLAPATISTDHPSSMAFVPGAPDEGRGAVRPDRGRIVDDRRRLDRRRRRDLGGEPGAALARRPRRFPGRGGRGVRERRLRGQPVGARRCPCHGVRGVSEAVRPAGGRSPSPTACTRRSSPPPA